MCQLADDAGGLKKPAAKRSIEKVIELSHDDENGDVELESDFDEQEEWNKQIEEDSKILANSSGESTNSPAKKMKV